MIVAEPIAPLVPAQAAALSEPPTPQFSRGLLSMGFVVGLVLAGLCLGIAGWYLISYLEYGTGAMVSTESSQAPEPRSLMAHMYMARVLLQSCGLAVGMAFGFLGFSLFLLGVGGNIDASATAGGGLGIQVARISPGAFVMLCSAILVGLCATQDVRATMGGSGESVDAVGDAGRLGILASEDAGGSTEGVRDLPPDPPAANTSGAAAARQATE